MEIIGVGTEPNHKIYLRATSEMLNFHELAKLTKLKPADGWNKGDRRKHGNSLYSFSCVKFMPNPEPDEFEDKINKLLDFLEKDVEAVVRTILCKLAVRCILSINFYALYSIGLYTCSLFQLFCPQNL